MKRWILIIIAIILTGIVGIGFKLNSDFDEVAKGFHSEHSLKPGYHFPLSTLLFVLPIHLTVP